MRTGTVSYKLEDLRKGVIIPIGMVGENDFTRVIFDAEEVFKKHPDAQVTMKVQPPKGGIYPATVTRDGNAVIWQVKAADVAHRGSGELQLTFTDDTMVEKSYIARTDIKRSLVGNGPAPDPVQDWVDNAEEVLEDLEEAEVHQPTIGTDGYWYKWNQETGEYEKTDTKAQGADGHSPVLTSSKSGKTTTIYADGTQLAQIQDGEDGQGADVIDDTAGEGDTDKTWSANKLDTEITDVKNNIDGLKPTAQQSDIGKALILKTIDQTGKPTAFEYGEAGGGSVDPSVVEQKVDEWLEENISNPESPPLDRSLSSGSAAAPADIVGTITEELDWQDTTTNLLTGATKSTGYKIDGDGNKASSSNYDVFEIAYDGSYPSFNATLYSNSNYQMKAISFLNSQGTVLSTLGYPETTGASTFTNQAIPSGTAKILLNNKRSMGDPACTCETKYSKRLSDIEGDITVNAQAMSAMKLSTKNLFDVSAAHNGNLINRSNGNMQEYTEHIASDYIEVSANTIYTISAKEKNTLRYVTTGLRYAFYNSSKEFISGSDDPAATTFRTPSTAKYIRFSMYNTLIEMQLERRHFATKYAPYNAHVLDDESETMFLNYPSKLYAITGLQYNFYMFNVTPEQYAGQFAWNFNKDSTKMHNYGRFMRLESNNSSASDIKCKADVRSLTKWAEKEFVIKVTNPADLDNVSVLVLGDSTTANGYVVTDLHGYDGNENKITTLGTLGTAPYNHEGRSGWTLNGYFTTSANNPFYNPSTQTFDAEYYFNQTGVDVPDLFIINLGINDMHYDSGDLYDAKATADAYIEKVNAVIESLRLVSATMKIAVCMTIPPNVDPYGFGAAGTNIIGYDQYRIANLVLCEKLIDEFDYRESEGLYLIPINASLDTQYNMPISAQLPNSRASETIMLPDTAGNVHPNAGGYYQIADVIYAFLCATFKTT